MDLFYPKSMPQTTVRQLLSDLHFSHTSAFFLGSVAAGPP